VKIEKKWKIEIETKKPGSSVKIEIETKKRKKTLVPVGVTNRD